MLKQIKAVVRDFAQDQRHKGTDSAILSILSHGENGKVIGKFIFFSVYPRRSSLDDTNITSFEQKCGRPVISTSLIYSQTSSNKRICLVITEMNFSYISLSRHGSNTPRRALSNGYEYYQCL